MTGRCDAPRCGSPAEVGDRLGGRYCAGHAYLRKGSGLVEPGLVEELRLERAAVVELEAERQAAFRRRDYRAALELRGELVAARARVGELELEELAQLLEVPS